MMRRWDKLVVWGKEIVFKQYRVGLKMEGCEKIYIGKHNHIMRKVRLYDFYGVEYTVLEKEIIDLILYIKESASNKIAILVDGSKYCKEIIEKICRWAKAIEQGEEVEMERLGYEVCKLGYYNEFLKWGEYVIHDGEDIILIGHTKGKALIIDRKKFEEMMMKLMVGYI